jgi:ABC-type phosphate transport system substrate-binding protein
LLLGLLAPSAPALAHDVPISGPFEGDARTLNGAGATFPAPLYAKWFNEYANVTGVHVNYQAIGSGGGINDWSPTTPIFRRSTRTLLWCTARTAQARRFGFTDYLSKVSPDWAQRVGKGTSVNWPVGLGASGNPGVTGEVQQNPYSIGCVELIYALQNGLGYGMVQNSFGAWVDPSLETVTAAAASAVYLLRSDLRFSIVNAPGENEYPVSTATWLLVYQEMPERSKALAVTRMVWWATHEGQRFNNDLAYATVPPQLTLRSEEFIRRITSGGRPVFPER